MDIRSLAVLGSTASPNGIIMLSQSDSVGIGRPLEYHCAFTADAMTNTRANYTEGNDLGEGCSTALFDAVNTYYASCKAAGVTDRASLIAYLDTDNKISNYTFY